jgi:hypothetical protein
MTFDQLSQKLRRVRSQMPRVSAEQAYAQMDQLLAAQKSSSYQRLPEGAEKLAGGEAKPRSGAE